MDHQIAASNPSITALLVGTDEVLLYTRKAILKKQGFAVSTAAPFKVFEALKSCDFDVVIACHTLKPAEADKLVQVARAKPLPPALVGFSKEMSPQPTSHPFDVSVWSLATPEAFVSKVREVLDARHR